MGAILNDVKMESLMNSLLYSNASTRMNGTVPLGIFNQGYPITHASYYNFNTNSHFTSNMLISFITKAESGNMKVSV